MPVMNAKSSCNNILYATKGCICANKMTVSKGHRVHKLTKLVAKCCWHVNVNDCCQSSPAADDIITQLLNSWKQNVSPRSSCSRNDVVWEKWFLYCNYSAWGWRASKKMRTSIIDTDRLWSLYITQIRYYYSFNSEFTDYVNLLRTSWDTSKFHIIK